MRELTIGMLEHMREVAALKAEVESLRKAYLSYVRADNGCPPWSGRKGCNGWGDQKCGCYIEAMDCAELPLDKEVTA